MCIVLVQLPSNLGLSGPKWNYESGLAVLCLVANKLFGGEPDKEKLQVYQLRNITRKYNIVMAVIYVFVSILIVC